MNSPISSARTVRQTKRRWRNCGVVWRQVKDRVSEFSLTHSSKFEDLSRSCDVCRSTGPIFGKCTTSCSVTGRPWPPPICFAMGPN
jgi:hypothetical protein